METMIQAIHFDATDALKAFAQKKIDKLARKNPEMLSADITMKVVKPETANNKEVTIQVYMPQRDENVVTKTADTFEEAIDLAIAALEPMLERYKDAGRR